MTRLPNGLRALASTLFIATLAVLAVPFALAGQAPVPKPFGAHQRLHPHRPDSGRALVEMRSDERMDGEHHC
jgi:hypothetical protein